MMRSAVDRLKEGCEGRGNAFRVASEVSKGGRRARVGGCGLSGLGVFCHFGCVRNALTVNASAAGAAVAVMVAGGERVQNARGEGGIWAGRRRGQTTMQTRLHNFYDNGRI